MINGLLFIFDFEIALALELFCFDDSNFRQILHF